MTEQKDSERRTKAWKTANKRDSVMLTENDFNAAEHIKDVHYLGSRAWALRFAARKQRERDEERRTKADEIAYRQSCHDIRESCMNFMAKGKEFGRDENNLRSWVFWRKQEVLDDLDAVEKYWHFANRSEAIRFCIRVQAEADGFKPKGEW